MRDTDFKEGRLKWPKVLSIAIYSKVNVVIARFCSKVFRGKVVVVWPETSKADI